MKESYPIKVGVGVVIVEKNIKNPMTHGDTHEHENAARIPQPPPHTYIRTRRATRIVYFLAVYSINPALKTDPDNHLVPMNVALLEGHVYHTYNI